MVTENQEQFQINYQAGKEALDRGKYRLSVQYLEKASKLVSYASRRGGEVQIMLLTAYQAAGKLEEAIALCQDLTTHAHPQIRKQAQDLLYILQAPRLNRPADWMSEIPDLGNLPESTLEERQGSGVTKIKEKPLPEFEDLNKINTQDNQFIWLALLVIIASLFGLIWLS